MQKEGDIEDENNISRAKELFKKRIMKAKGFKFD